MFGRQVHGVVGDGMKELLRWLAGARGPSSFQPRMESTPLPRAALGSKSENIRLTLSLRHHPVQSCHFTHSEVEAHRE